MSARVPTDRMKRNFGGHRVMLTGAASGLGRELAKLLAACGAEVHAADRDAAGLESLRTEAGGERLFPRVLDVTDREDYRRWVEEVAERGRIDDLISNAGVSLLGEAHRVPFERWKWLLDVNLMGVIHGVMWVYPRMVEQGGGRMIHTASIAAVTGYATAAAYTASKKAVLGMCDSLAAEATGYGVKVVEVCPGYIASNIFTEDRVTGAELGAVMKDLPAPMMTAEEAAWRYLGGVASGKARVIFPANARLLWTVGRWAPILLGPLQDRLLKAFVR